MTCKGWKRQALTEKYPDLCLTIAEVKESIPICPHPPSSNSSSLLDPILFRLNGSLLKLRDELYLYARDNLAVVNIYIKDATVTKIRRDQKVINSFLDLVSTTPFSHQITPDLQQGFASLSGLRNPRNRAKFYFSTKTSTTLKKLGEFCTIFLSTYLCTPL